MRISDWSSDVCSSDLDRGGAQWIRFPRRRDRFRRAGRHPRTRTGPHREAPLPGRADKQHTGQRRPLLPWRPRSLQARQLMAASLGLVAFLALAGYALDRAFVDVAGQVQRDRLKAYAYNYVGAIDFFRNGDIYVPEVPPDPRFDQPGSGLYAVIVLPEGQQSWRSMSTRGPQLPEEEMLAPNQEEFRGPLPIVKTSGEPGEVFRYGIGAAAVQDSGRGVEIARPYTVYVMADEGSLARQLRVFRTALWGYLGIAGSVLLLLQTLVLRWPLWPLRTVVTEPTRVQPGPAFQIAKREVRERG